MTSPIVAMTYPPWLIYPGSSARLTISLTGPKPLIEMVANRKGLASLSGILLWLTAYSDPCGLSVSGLPFVKSVGPLALSIALEQKDGDYQGRLSLLDKEQQYEWQVHDEPLLSVALLLHQLASHADEDHFVDVRLSPDSSARLRFDIEAGG